MESLVSVTFPAYCHAPFIEETMLSVYHQKHDRLELIIFDDKSSDDTFRIAKSLGERPWFRNRFERIVLEQNERNAGAHETLNKAMALARGDYISLLNSDDLYTPARISRLLEACLETNSPCAFSAVSPIDASGRTVFDDPLAQSIVLNARRVIENLPSLSFGFLRYQLSISTGNLFLERSFQKVIGDFIPLKYCHDWDYMLRIISKVEPVYIDEPLYQYRFHPGNSFKSLSEVALVESEIVLHRYFQRVLSGTIENSNAPTPRNWPGVFEVIAENFEVLALWKRMHGEYPNHFKTVDSYDKKRPGVDIFNTRLLKRSGRAAPAA